MEKEYIREILNGNPSRFSYFVATYKDMAYSIAFRVVNNREDAEEIVQDSFMRAYRSLSKFRLESKFSTWFYKIVVNKALSIRKLLKLNEVDIEDIPEIQSDQLECAYNNLEKEDRSRFINSALERMDPEDSLILTLFYLNENSIEEINEITGIPKENLKMKLLRARRKLHFLLEKILRLETKSII